jgi:hypothetical protein
LFETLDVEFEFEIYDSCSDVSCSKVGIADREEEE